MEEVEIHALRDPLASAKPSRPGSSKTAADPDLRLMGNNGGAGGICMTSLQPDVADDQTVPRIDRTTAHVVR